MEGGMDVSASERPKCCSDDECDISKAPPEITAGKEDKSKKSREDRCCSDEDCESERESLTKALLPVKPIAAGAVCSESKRASSGQPNEVDAACCRDGKCSKKTPGIKPVTSGGCCSDEECTDKVVKGPTNSNVKRAAACCSDEECEDKPKQPVAAIKKDACCSDEDCDTKPKQSVKQNVCCSDEECETSKPVAATVNQGACCSNEDCTAKPTQSNSKVKKNACCSDEECEGKSKPEAATVKKDACCSDEECEDKPAATVKTDACCSDEECEDNAAEPVLQMPRENSTIVSGGEFLAVSISGMTCVGCATSIEGRLKRQVGVSNAKVTFLAERGEVWYDPKKTNEAALCEEIRRLGFELAVCATDAYPSTNLDLSAYLLTPGASLEDAISRVTSVVGVVGHKMNLEDNTLAVSYDSTRTGARIIISAFPAGTVRIAQAVDSGIMRQTRLARDIARWKRRFYTGLALSLPAFIIAFLVPSSDSIRAVFETKILNNELGSWLLLALAIPTQFWVGRPLLESGFKSVRYGEANMDVLVSLSTLTAFCYSTAVMVARVLGWASTSAIFLETVTLLITFVMLGRYLELKARASTSTALTTMLSLQAPTATLLNGDGTQETIDAALIQPGDLLLVPPGSRIPTDGVVVEGTTTVDESFLTGESVPVVKEPGSAVTGGAVNQLGSITMRATSLPGETVLMQIVKMVEAAQASQAPVQRYADKVASVFVPCIVGVAVLTFFVWLYLSSNPSPMIAAQMQRLGYTSPLSFSVLFFISILVISCPCAVSLSVPTAVMVGTTVAARFGVLIKGGATIESTWRVTDVVFDKTGTITKGSPRVVDSYQVLGTSAGEFFAILGGVEKSSEHIFARSIVEHAETITSLCNATDCVAVPGKGMIGQIEGRTVVAGTPALLNEHGVMLDAETTAFIARSTASGCSIVCAAYGGALIGAVALIDAVKPEASDVVRTLQLRGVSVHMLSGDAPVVCDRIGAEVGIMPDCIHGGVLPGGKADLIKKLMSDPSRVVMMVGDGTNDAPALAQAHIGVAIGSGTDIAIESADVVLIKNNIWDLLTFIDLCGVVMRRIRYNLMWAFGYNLLGIPFAAGVFIGAHLMVPPAAAGLSEIISSIPVILFSYMLTRYRSPYAEETVQHSGYAQLQEMQV